MRRLFVFEKTEKIFAATMTRLAAGSFLASAALLFALFFGEAVAGEASYAELGHALALFSALGSIASAGCLAFFVLRIHAGDPGPWTLAPSSSREPFTDAGTKPGKEWPLLITLLFRKIPVLFAGLAGWVEARA